METQTSAPCHENSPSVLLHSGPAPGCHLGQRSRDGDGGGDAVHSLWGSHSRLSGQPALPARLQVPLGESPCGNEVLYLRIQGSCIPNSAKTAGSWGGSISPTLNPASSPCIPQPILRSRLKTEDTCGVHNVHGLPGILGTFLGTLLAALATADVYGDR